MKNKILLVFLAVSFIFTAAAIIPAPVQAKPVTQVKLKNLDRSTRYPKKIQLTWKKNTTNKKINFQQVRVLKKKANGKYKKIKRVKTKKNVRKKLVTKLSYETTYYFRGRHCRTKTKCGPWSSRVKGKTKVNPDADDGDDDAEDGDGDGDDGDDADPDPSPDPDPDPTPAPEFTISTTAFTDGGNIPAAYTCDGANISPGLSWENAPDGTQSFVLIVRDIDAPGGDFFHWGIKDISSSSTGFDEDTAVADGTEVTNDFSEADWGGPCPPIADGAHTYQFEIYALSVLSISGSTVSEIETNMSSDILDSDYITGEYDRN